jgi:hypothetical protein
VHPETQQGQTKLLQLPKLRLAKLQITFHKNAVCQGDEKSLISISEHFETVTPRKLAQTAALQACIRKALGSNPGRMTNYPDWGLS